MMNHPKGKEPGGGIDGPQSSGPPAAFTLIEVLLSLVLIALLTGAVVVGVTGGIDRGKLDEGSQQFEALLRLARAEAAQKSLTFRLSFDLDGRMIVEWEPQPLAEPGNFLPYTASMWASDLPNEQVRIASCIVLGKDAYIPPEGSSMRTNVGSGEDDEQVILDPILFRPDGTFDDAEIRLISTDPGDPRTAIVTLQHSTLRFATQILTQTELKELDEAIEESSS